MAKLSIVRLHTLSFLDARKLAKSWITEGEEQFFLEGEYREGEDGEEKDIIDFSRKGLSGSLTVTPKQYELELTLGFLFSAYRKKITATIHENMDKQLGEVIANDPMTG